MQAMMAEDTRCISLAAFGSAAELQGYLDGFSCSEKKAKANAADELTGMTPLLAACRRESDASLHVQILIACGAVVGKASHVGWTPLMAATRYSSASRKIKQMLQATEGQYGYVEPGMRVLFT